MQGPKNKFFPIFITIVVLSLTSLACSLGGSDASITDPPTQLPAVEELPNPESSPPTETTSAVSSAAEIELGNMQRNEEGGFGFRSAQGYTLQSFGGISMILAPEGDQDNGPLIGLIGGLDYTGMTNEKLYEQLQQSNDLETGPSQEIKLQGVPALKADMQGTRNEVVLKGQVVLCMLTDTHQIVAMALAPEEKWESLQPVFDAVLNSMEFFEPTPAKLTLNIPPGKHLYTNANVGRDVVIYQNIAYVATLGGMLIWDLDAGTGAHQTTLDGMGQISAHSIAVCDIPETRIIVGTQTGLSIYDPAAGVWDNIPLVPDESRVSLNKVTRVYCDARNQRLLIGYNGLGVLDLATGDWKQYTTTEGISWNAITDITVSGKDIWIASGYNGISRISGDSVTIYNEAGGMPSERAQAVAAGPDGVLWVGTSRGLVKFSSGKWTLYDSSTTPGMTPDINEVEIASDGMVWTASAPLGGGDFCHFDPRSESCVGVYISIDSQAVLGMALDEQDRPVYTTSKGTYLINGEETRSFILEGEQLATNYVDSLASDSAGMLWVGTDGGVQTFDPAFPDDTWITYRSADDGTGPGGNWASGILQASNGSMWFTMINGSVSHYQDGSWTVYKDYYSYDVLAEDSQGRIWLADDRKGITVLDSSGAVALTLAAENGLPDGVHALLADGEIMWIGTTYGLARFENEQLEVVFGKDDPSLPATNIADLALAPDGALLVGSVLGVARLSDGQVDLILDTRQQQSNGFITCLAVGPDGEIYAGTSDGLFYSKDAQTWVHATTTDGFPTNYINDVHVDNYGTLWVGGGASFDGGGLLRVIP